jgi:hypothetical protein
VLALVAADWHQVRLASLPLAVTGAMHLLTAVVHSRELAGGTWPYAWWILGALVPILLAAAPARRSAPRPRQPLPMWLRWLCLGNGAVLVYVCVVLLIVPQAALNRGPWDLTPLLVRTFASGLLGLGLLLALIGDANDVRQVRIASVQPLLFGVCLAVQLARFGSQVDWSHPVLLVLLADLLLFSAIFGLAWVRGLNAPRPTYRATAAAVPGAAISLGRRR